MQKRQMPKSCSQKDKSKNVLCFGFQYEVVSDDTNGISISFSPLNSKAVENLEPDLNNWGNWKSHFFSKKVCKTERWAMIYLIILNLEMNKTKSSHRYVTSLFGTILKMFEICIHVKAAIQMWH